MTSSVRNAALDALGEALLKAEQHLFALNPGVEARVVLEVTTDPHTRVNDAVYLAWGKFDNRWCLHLQCERGGPPMYRLPLLESRIAYRKAAARNLVSLHRVLCGMADAEIADIYDAADAAQSFARGLHD